MPLTLSWDLFIVAFFAIVMSYSFLIGKDQSMKLMIAAYIAIIATQGISSMLIRLTGSGDAVFRSVGMQSDPTLVSLAKIFVFAVCIIVFVTRSGIELTHDKDTGMVLGILYTALFGFSTAGLIVSTVLTYAGGGSSMLMQLLILNQDIWFTLPAFLIIAVGMIHSD